MGLISGVEGLAEDAVPGAGWVKLLVQALPYFLGIAALIGGWIAFHRWEDGIKRDAMAAQAQVDQKVMDKLKGDIAAETAAAQRADLEHARTVEAAQTTISDEVSRDYETKLAALRARLGQLRTPPAAHLAGGGGGEGADLPGISHPAREPDDAAVPDGFLGLAFQADAQTQQLISLQRWVAEQQQVKR